MKGAIGIFTHPAAGRYEQEHSFTGAGAKNDLKVFRNGMQRHFDEAGFRVLDTSERSIPDGFELTVLLQPIEDRRHERT